MEDLEDSKMFQANLLEFLAMVLIRLVVSFCNTRKKTNKQKKNTVNLIVHIFLPMLLKKNIFFPLHYKFYFISLFTAVLELYLN